MKQKLKWRKKKYVVDYCGDQVREDRLSVYQETSWNNEIITTGLLSCYYKTYFHPPWLKKGSTSKWSVLLQCSHCLHWLLEIFMPFVIGSKWPCIYIVEPECNWLYLLRNLCMFVFGKRVTVSREMAQWLSVLTALTEGLNSVPSIHIR